MISAKEQYETVLTSGSNFAVVDVSCGGHSGTAIVFSQDEGDFACLCAIDDASLVNDPVVC